MTGHHPDRGPVVFSVTTATLVVATVFVALRLIGRVAIVRHTTWDDYIIIVAWLLAFALSLTIDLATRLGLGRHDADIPDSSWSELRKCEYVFSILYNPALMAARASILVFYLRLSRNTRRFLRRASWAVLVVVVAAGVILTLLNIFQCRPIRASWDVTVREAKCIPLLTEFVCSAPVNIVTALAILALPIPAITGMQLPHRQKTILVFTFTLGIFDTIVDVIRIYYLQRAVIYAPRATSASPTEIFGDVAEFSWSASLAFMWSAVEVNVGIMCACIPTLKPLVVRVLPGILFDTVRVVRDAGKSAANGGDGQPDSSGTSHPATTGSHPEDAPQEPVPAHMQAQRRDSEEVSLRHFLGTATTNLTHSTAAQPPQAPEQENTVYFGFVNMKRPKSMLNVSGPEAFKYCTAVTLLFFLWGFSYGLLNTLNNVVAARANISTAQTLGLTSMYFGGYFFGPLIVGQWVLRHDEQRCRKKPVDEARNRTGGFKSTFITGLLIYGAGTIMFWPSAVLNAFGGFMFSNFVVGFGLSVLETAANPFLALCGPPRYSDMRLLLAQGIQGVGAVVSGLLAEKVFFQHIGTHGISKRLSLLGVQWTYLAITLFCVLLALVFYYMPLPEASDDDLALAARRLPVDPKKPSIGGRSLRTWNLLMAVTAQWACVGSQESMSFYFGSLLTSLLPDTPPTGAQGPKKADWPDGLALSIPDNLLVAHSAFALSRFIAGYIAYLSARHPRWRWVPMPRMLLIFYGILNLLTTILIVALPSAISPNMLFIPIVLFYVAEAPFWPMIFSLGLRGQGRHTKQAAAFLTMGGSGASAWPYIIYGIMQSGAGVRLGFVVVVVLICAILAYPLFLTFVKDARFMVDDPKDLSNASDSGGQGGTLGPDLELEDHPTSGGRESRTTSRDSYPFPRPSPQILETVLDNLRSVSRERRWLGRGEPSQVAQRHSRETTQSQAAGVAPWEAPEVSRMLSPWEAQELDTSILQRP